jgi:TRAP-type C4-dicarboxylate transport system permease small subunit
MDDSSADPSSPRAARLLKGAALLFVAMGTGFLVWLGRQWTRYPEMKASQFGFEAPLWPALGGFVLLAIVAVVGLFWRAARRVERGENLFAQRHRRRRSDGPGPTNGSPSSS